MIPAQSQSGLHDFSLIESPGSDTDISRYEESESPLGEEKGKRSEYEGNGDGNYLLGIKKHRRREREKKLFSGDLIIRLDEQTDREVKSREEKKEEVEEKEKVHLLGDNLGASLSRLSSASVSAT